MFHHLNASNSGFLFLYFTHFSSASLTCRFLQGWGAHTPTCTQAVIWLIHDHPFCMWGQSTRVHLSLLYVSGVRFRRHTQQEDIIMSSFLFSYVGCICVLPASLPPGSPCCCSVSSGVKPALSFNGRPVWTSLRGSTVCLSWNLQIGSCGAAMSR